MPLKVKHIKQILEDFAPLNLKQSYDNVGLMVGELDCEITSILVALDCTLEVISEAKNKGCNIIVTHHPLLFLKPESITDETLLGKKILTLIKNNINVYSSHTNLDAVQGGMNDIITQLLGYKEYEIMESFEKCNGLYKGGIGRLISLSEEITLKDLLNKIKSCLNISHLRYAGREDMVIRKVAVINGSGEDYFSISKRKGADCIITGDTSYHYVSDYCEEGLGIIDAGHFETEWPSMKFIAKMLQEKINSMEYKNKVIISEKSETPYKYI